MANHIVPAWSAPDGTPYQPSNGTEGEGFFNGWCANCQHDKAMNGTLDEDECGTGDFCEIIAKTMAFKPGDKEYPVEWLWKAGKPTCTKFRHVDAEPLRERCDHTVDMFPAEQRIAVNEGTKARLLAKRGAA